MSHIDLMINIDGMPLFKSSSGELWPILGSVMNVPNLVNKVFPIGVYYGVNKPLSNLEFLKDFVAEILDLIQNGIVLKGKSLSVILNCLSCDAPAKAFVLGIKWYMVMVIHHVLGVSRKVSTMKIG